MFENENKDGEALDEQENEKAVKIPPLPDDAIEFGGKISLESMIDMDVSEEKAPQQIDNAMNEFFDESVSPVVDTEPVSLTSALKSVDSDVVNALDDVEDEAIVSPAKSKGPVLSSSPIIKISSAKISTDNQELAADSIQNALYDDSNEGGVVKNKSTGSMKIIGGDVLKDAESMVVTPGSGAEFENKYRLYGFTIQYNVKDKTGVVSITTSEEVSVYFEDLENAMICVNGSKYIKHNANGTVDIVNIVSGIPSISHNDQNLYQYSGGKIGFGGYWKRS